MKIKFKKGFTLLEILIVVAIIGILSAVVLAALNNARNKGGDAGIKANLRNANAQAEIFWNTNTTNPNTYTSVCTNGTVGGVLGVGSFVLAAAKDDGLSSYNTNGAPSLPSQSVASCNDSAGAWAAQVPLSTASGTNQMWCVDSTGKSKQESGDSFLGSGTDYTCN